MLMAARVMRQRAALGTMEPTQFPHLEFPTAITSSQSHRLN